MNRKWIFGAIALVIALVGGWYVVSPMLALKNMQTAMEARDADALSAQIDFPALREDLKAEMVTAMMAEAQKKGEQDSAGTMLGMAFADKMIDGMVSPAGVKMLMANADSAPAPGNITMGATPNISDFNSDKFDIQRNGFSEFTLRNKEDPKKGGIIFRRDGLGWKLVGIDLPAEGIGK